MKVAAGRRAIQSLSESKVEHFDFALGGDLHVGGFQIAMDDAFLVRSLERFADLMRHVQCFIERKRTTPQEIR